MPHPAYAVMALVSLGNFLIFFFGMRNVKRYSPKEIHRRKVYSRSVQQGEKRASIHKCAVCGRTEKDGDDLVFRYCSKCNGNYEYCQDHLFTARACEIRFWEKAFHTKCMMVIFLQECYYFNK